jgi:hypothetical protein
MLVSVTTNRVAGMNRALTKDRRSSKPPTPSATVTMGARLSESHCKKPNRSPVWRRLPSVGFPLSPTFALPELRPIGDISSWMAAQYARHAPTRATNRAVPTASPKPAESPFAVPTWTPVATHMANQTRCHTSLKARIVPGPLPDCPTQEPAPVAGALRTSTPLERSASAKLPTSTSDGTSIGYRLRGLALGGLISRRRTW